VARTAHRGAEKLERIIDSGVTIKSQTKNNRRKGERWKTRRGKEKDREEEEKKGTRQTKPLKSEKGNPKEERG